MAHRLTKKTYRDQWEPSIPLPVLRKILRALGASERILCDDAVDPDKHDDLVARIEKYLVDAAEEKATWKIANLPARKRRLGNACGTCGAGSLVKGSTPAKKR